MSCCGSIWTVPTRAVMRSSWRCGIGRVLTHRRPPRWHRWIGSVLSSVAGLYRQLTDSDAEAYAKAYLFYSYVFGSSLVDTSGSVFNDDAELRQRCAALLV